MSRLKFLAIGYLIQAISNTNLKQRIRRPKNKGCVFLIISLFLSFCILTPYRNVFLCEAVACREAYDEW